MAYRLVWLEKKHGDPQFFRALFYLVGRKTNNQQNIKKFCNAIKKCENFILYGKMFLA
jgi:hypothetical protein